MPKESLHIRKSEGSLVIEAMLAIGIFAMLVTIFVGALGYGQESTALAGARSRAAFLADEGLEAARSIRDKDFTALTDGNHGIALANGVWSFSGTSDVSGIFTRQIVISTVSSNTKLITSTITWTQTPQRQGSYSVSTRLTNWRTVYSMANSLEIDLSGAHLGGPSNKTNQLQGIILRNISPFQITIDKMKLTWSSAGRRMELITIGGVTAWSIDGPGTPIGNKQPSGTLIDIQNYTLPVGQYISLDAIQWDGTMVGNTMTLEFTMIDGSTSSRAFNPSAL